MCPPCLPQRSTRWGCYLPLPLKKLVHKHVCMYTHTHTDGEGLCQDNTIFNLLLKVRLRYHRCQQHSFVSQERNSSHTRLGFGRRQALGLSRFNKPIHAEGCFLGSALKSTSLATISYPPQQRMPPGYHYKMASQRGLPPLSVWRKEHVWSVSGLSWPAAWDLRPRRI